MQKASPKSKGPGRPSQFDPDAVLSAATVTFWEKGFDAATLADLEAATGVDRSTLYNSFGGKSGLYSKATAAYLTHAEHGLFAPLHHGTDNGNADIIEFLGRLRHGLSNPEAPPGCLIVNDMASGTHPDAAKRYLQLLETGLQAALRRAGDSDAAAIDRRAQLIASSVIGANLISKTSSNSNVVARLIDAIAAEVQTWPTT